MPQSVPRTLQLQAPTSSSIYVPFPKLVLKVFHVGEGLEVFKSEKTATQEARDRMAAFMAIGGQTRAVELAGIGLTNKPLTSD